MRTKTELAAMIRDLVRIAKVAMPPDLFEQDPRIKKANAYLVALGDPSPLARPPNAGRSFLAALLPELEDLRPVNASKLVLDWDLVDPILAAREHGLSEDDSKALNYIVRDWLIAHGYLVPTPDETN